jgi:hypothetical protein
MHGGTAHGPITPEGLARSKKARWVHGFYSAEAKAQRRAEQKELREMIQALRRAASTMLGPQME